MKRINDREVELTHDDEHAACDYFEQLLDQGLGIEAAAKAVKVTYDGLDEDFYEYLNEDRPVVITLDEV